MAFSQSAVLAAALSFSAILSGCDVKEQRAQAADLRLTYKECLRRNSILDRHRKEVMLTIYLIGRAGGALGDAELPPTPPPDDYDCAGLKK